MTAEPVVDVLVIGAGPAGSAAAMVLARRGLRVAVWESASAAVSKVGETLPPSARPLLSRLRIAERIEADGHLASFGTLSAWGSPSLAGADFIFHPDGHGWQLDRGRFDGRLTEAAHEAGAAISFSTRLIGISDAKHSWSAEGDCDGSPIRLLPRWLLDASGRRCAVARRLGVQRLAEDRLVGVCAIAHQGQSSGEPDRDTRTLVEAVPDGWWYTAIMPKGKRRVVWLCDGDMLQNHPRRTAGWFQDLLRTTVHVRSVLDRHGYCLDEAPRCTTACSGRLNRWGGSNWSAVGDAACSFDPLSSQGIMHALDTGITAGHAVADALEGNTAPIRRYYSRLGEAWDRYLRHRRAYYRQENRWTDREFWHRRH